MGKILRFPVVALLAFCLAAFCAVVPEALHAAATKEQCSCDLGDENDREDGAEVSNASACVLTTHSGRNWCIFDIDTLNGSAAHGELVARIRAGVAAGDPGLIRAAVDERLRRWLEFGDAARTLDRFDAPAEPVVAEIDGRLADASDLLLECMAAFVSGERFAVDDLRESNGVACGVHPGGWVTLLFRFDGFDLFYLFAHGRG